MIITLICVLIGLAIQFFAPIDIDTSIFLLPLSAALIAFSPTLAIPKRTRIKEEDKTGVFLNKWHTIPSEDIESTFERIESETFGKIKFSPAGNIFRIMTGALPVIIAVIISVLLFLQDKYYASAIIFDIILVPRALFYIVYGCSPEESKAGTQAYNLSSKTTETVKHLIKNQETLNHYHPEVQLDLIKQGSVTDIRDVRCNLVPQSEIPNFLCAQFSITKTQVKDTTFPYAYFVIVFKGEKMAQKKKRQVQNEISQILHVKAPNFSLEVNQSDGNSVFVMTKKRGRSPYYTDDEDCRSLSLAADDILGYLESNKF